MFSRIFLLFFCFLNSAPIIGQESDFLWLEWSLENDRLQLNNSSNNILELDYKFEGVNYFDVSISNLIFEDCLASQISEIDISGLSSFPQIKIEQGVERKNTRVKVQINPFVVIDGKLKKMMYAKLNWNMSPNKRKDIEYAQSSVLGNGNWYKLATNSDGIFVVTYDDLLSLGLDVESINPNRIALFGKPGGMLALDNSEFRYDDLQQLAVQVVGADDNSFDQDDYIIFYGESPDQWVFNTDNNQFDFSKHLYDSKSYYFITVLNEDGKRIANVSSISGVNKNVYTFNTFEVHEKEEYNFVKSGRKWYGDKFGASSTKTFNFSIPNLASEIALEIDFASRVPSPYLNSFAVSANGMNTETVSLNPVFGSYTYANEKSIVSSFMPTSSNVDVSISYNSNYSGAEGYIDKIELHALSQLKMNGNQMKFRSVESIGPGNVTQFNLANANNSIKIWDVTNALDATNLLGELNSNSFSFSVRTDTLREFIAFGNDFKNVELLGSVQNQDLHVIDNADFVIVSHPNFIAQANRLANIHRSFDNMSVVVVTPQQIYNEFSSGSQDVSAIRDFAKMLYSRQTNPLKYMLLFGDASYDPKSRISDNTNFIVSYQSENSKSYIDSYVSDDFFAILDDNESISQASNTVPFLDIGVGRFPVTTIEQAEIAVDKVETYYSSQALGDWRLNVSFVGDDNDEKETVHSNQAEQLADQLAAANPLMNIDKLYLDSYQQVSSAGGQRCPDINQAINETIAKGTFLVNYTGHGGELGWAHERILEISDINSWENGSKLPLFMTATCEFSRYDDPERVSAGEQVFLKENGGAIALLTTSRVVFTGSNFDMNESFFDNLFPLDNHAQRLGDVIMSTKNNVDNISSTNHRNFTLLGNPALALAFPKLQVVLTEVQDSAKALGKVTLSGEIRFDGQKVDDFNGYLSSTIFDKKSDYQTLQQDESPLIIFDLQKNILFKGMSSVNGGEFSLSFIVPRDLNYDFGNAKVSLYAFGSTDQDSIIDGSGYNLDMILGGTSNDFEQDENGPDIDLYMDNVDFENGDITNENPSLLAVLFDKNGINTVGNGIGHDVTAVLDKESTNPIVLNSFYQSDIDSYQSGKIVYPFNSLSEGKHTLSVKVWDVFNNSSEDELEFLVVKSSNLSIQNLMNYPNPVIDYTDFYFDHNQNGNELDISFQIVDIQGRLVYSFSDKILPTSNNYGPIRWNSKSSSNVDLNQGVYIYSIILTAPNGESLQKSARLILLD